MKWICGACGKKEPVAKNLPRGWRMTLHRFFDHGGLAIACSEKCMENMTPDKLVSPDVIDEVVK